eukprot:337577-Hanusia_phi.AAC.1
MEMQRTKIGRRRNHKLRLNLFLATTKTTKSQACIVFPFPWLQSLACRKRKDHQGGEDQPRKRTSPKKAKTDWEDTVSTNAFRASPNDAALQTLDADEADVKESYAKLDFRVHFGPLSSSTSNVKLSFRIQENMEVTIKDLSQHIVNASSSPRSR